MSFYTQAEARAAAQSQVIQKSDDVVLRECASVATDTDSFDIFLSHSISDATLVRGVKRILETQGFTVYVDWVIDPQLNRSNVTKDTAALLRKRMTQCRSLIYVSTVSASSSRWMPWELGYFDGLKKGNVAIMPLVNTDQDTFTGQEYLGLYPLVEKNKYTNGEKVVIIKEPGVRWSTLSSFSNGNPGWTGFGK